MPTKRPPSRSPRPRRTVRLRLTALYGVMFLISGAIVLGIASGVVVSRSSVEAAPTRNQVVPQSALAQADARIQQLQHELAAATGPAGNGISHSLIIGSVIALGIMTVISVLLGWLVAGRVLRPLRQMTAATRRISADSLDERLAVTGPGDELKDLADTIDGLLERLENAFTAQRRFVANASHELRTPLTTMRASLDVAVAKPGPVPASTIALADRLRTELDRVDQLLEGLLVLARAQHSELPGLVTLSLESVVSAALAARAGDIAARHLTVHHATGQEGAWVQGSQALLCRMADNVIGNAIDHNAEGGWISITTGADGQSARLVVENGGDVIDQRELDQLGQPFRRLGADRTGSDTGSGLGLSIVAAIASAHRGTLDLQARPEGGLRVSITLPLAAQAGTTQAARAGVPA
ncbi:MAG TPA: HAMP domain-containing sensor histidine kinase [Streptosporangiaceae bacterium]